MCPTTTVLFWSKAMLRTVTPTGWLRLQWIHLFAKGSPGCASAFWSLDPDKPRRTKLAVFLTTLLTSGLPVNHAMARFMDATGCGDNLIARFVPREVG